jgi:peroxiredoxin
MVHYCEIGGSMKRFAFVPALVFALSLIGLHGTAGALEVGDKAPDFELPSTQGTGKLKLSDFAGKKYVVVQFYVLDFTPT